MTQYNIIDFGASGDGIADDANGIQKAIDTCSENGGGRVIIPAGKIFMTGPFDFKSNVELYVERGAKIIANPNEAVYTKSAFRENRSEGTIWIGGENADNIAITGGGVIDGRGQAFMDGEDPAAYRLKPVTEFDPRPHLLTLVGCKNITIRDVTFTNSAYWCVHLAGCQDVVIDGVRILNDLKIRNGDGIDPDHCRNVRISNCHIESGDDCICIKNRREYAEFGPCENIVVTNCTMTSTSCAIKLGSENMDAIRNVIFDSCIILSSNRGIGIQHRDEGSVENVSFSNMIVESRLFDDVWWGKAEPIYITSFNRNPDAKWRFPGDGQSRDVGYVKNIRFHNVSCTSEGGVYISGNGKSIVEDILLENVRLHINKWTKHAGGLYDRRPCDVQGIIERDVAAFSLVQAKDITVRNCQVMWGNNRPAYYGAALEAEHVSNLKIENLIGESAQPDRIKSVNIT
ncbi:MAG: right-handed parallel beta-helix repeat-containing protein [Deferribacteres bacterium]|nr:right-handed parallel beta-helix repeat-containing protein [candidate division KSB1 bacterium]MCB9501583.1 right-handed parallel beta-helix repeat-containing protein [Deferribacteres bacterium]